jgi:Abortive infection C-terminus
MDGNGVGRLATSDVHWVATRYIGVSDGYLGDFSQRSHREFYSAFCDISIDPDAFPGTTREKFIAVLNAVDATAQASILRGVARKYPQGSEAHRTAEAFKHLASLARKCSSALSVAQHDPKISSAVVRQALADASVLLRERGPASAVDRIHTALHGYLEALCSRHGLPAKADANVPSLFKCVRSHHPVFRDTSDASPSVKALQGLAQIVEALNTARNHNSLAHPNDALLDANDATLALNCANALIQYLDTKTA